MWVTIADWDGREEKGGLKMKKYFENSKLMLGGLMGEDHIINVNIM